MRKLLLLFIFAGVISCENEDILESPQENSKTELDKIKSESASFKADQGIKKTFVPDDNFEQLLIDLDYDDFLDDYVLTSNINTIENLTLFNPSIIDLTGLEDFESLEELTLRRVDISSLNISNHLNLKRLYFYNIESLPTVDISNNVNLETLILYYAKFTALDLSKNMNLKTLTLTNSGISNFDISNNKNLETLYFIDHSSTNLNVSKNVKLATLYTNTSHFNAMDLSNNKNLKVVGIDNAGEGPNILNIYKVPSLTGLFINDSGLTSLDLSKNSNLADMNVTGNPLTCIKVSKKQLKNIPKGWIIDYDDVYSLDCGK